MASATGTTKIPGEGRDDKDSLKNKSSEGEADEVGYEP